MKNQNYINNQWCDSDSGSRILIENPFTQETITSVPHSSKTDVAQAVSFAKAAWEKNQELIPSDSLVFKKKDSKQ